MLCDVMIPERQCRIPWSQQAIPTPHWLLLYHVHHPEGYMHEACGPIQCPFLRVLGDIPAHPYQQPQSVALRVQADFRSHIWQIQICLPLDTQSVPSQAHLVHLQCRPVKERKKKVRTSLQLCKDTETTQ